PHSPSSTRDRTTLRGTPEYACAPPCAHRHPHPASLPNTPQTHAPHAHTPAAYAHSPPAPRAASPETSLRDQRTLWSFAKTRVAHPFAALSRKGGLPSSPQPQPPRVSSCLHHLPPLRPRMMHPMHRLQPIDRQMRIHLRRRYIGMPQQYLHRAQIRTMLHHMSRAAMPQLVRARLRVQPLHRPPHTLRRQRLPPHRNKQRPLQTHTSVAAPVFFVVIPEGNLRFRS